MKISTILWGAILILAGVSLMLSALGFNPKFFWHAAVIFAGIALIALGIQKIVTTVQDKK